jgi:hypothetical protein
MSALKQALESAINQWEESQKPQEKQMPKHLFAPTNNVTRATFNSVRDNPGKKAPEHYAMLAAQGFKTSSTTSLMHAFIKCNYIRRNEDGLLYTLIPEYVPINTSKLKKATATAKTVSKVVQEKPKIDAGIAALKNPQPLEQVMRRSAIITTNFSVENIIKNLTIYQAKDLRDALNNLFK